MQDQILDCVLSHAPVSRGHLDGGCHINGEYCRVLVKQKLAPREINDLGCVEADLEGQPNGYT